MARKRKFEFVIGELQMQLSTARQMTGDWERGSENDTYRREDVAEYRQAIAILRKHRWDPPPPYKKKKRAKPH